MNSNKVKKKEKEKEKKVDKSVDMTFPASDTPAHGNATGTEAPARPADREAPAISKEDVERARRGTDQKQDEQ